MMYVYFVMFLEGGIQSYSTTDRFLGNCDPVCFLNYFLYRSVLCGREVSLFMFVILILFNFAYLGKDSTVIKKLSISFGNIFRIWPHISIFTYLYTDSNN